jgi:hypothetical protein
MRLRRAGRAGKSPAAERAPHFQTLDGTKRILGIDANLVFGLAHGDRL